MSEHPTHKPQSLPQRPQSDLPARRPNMGDLDRVASFVGGCALGLYGLRRSLGHLALVVGGGALVYRALRASTQSGTNCRRSRTLKS